MSISYSPSTVRDVLRMTRYALERDLSRAGVCGPFTGWTKDELIRVWLEKRAATREAVEAGR